MIKTFEQYNDLDPYNEENWDGGDDMFKVGDRLYNFDKFFGNIVEIKVGERVTAYKIEKDDGMIYVFSDMMMKSYLDQGALTVIR